LLLLLLLLQIIGNVKLFAAVDELYNHELIARLLFVHNSRT
jgi:hypothetical protein